MRDQTPKNTRSRRIPLGERRHTNTPLIPTSTRSGTRMKRQASLGRKTVKYRWIGFRNVPSGATIGAGTVSQSHDITRRLQLDGSWHAACGVAHTRMKVFSRQPQNNTHTNPHGLRLCASHGVSPRGPVVVRRLGLVRVSKGCHRKFRGHNFESCVTNFDKISFFSLRSRYGKFRGFHPSYYKIRSVSDLQNPTATPLTQAGAAHRGTRLSGDVGGWGRRWRDS